MTTYAHRDGRTSRTVKSDNVTHSIYGPDGLEGWVHTLPTNVGPETRYRAVGAESWQYAPSFIHAVGYLIGSPVVKVGG